MAGCLFLDARSSLILHTIIPILSTKTPLSVDRGIKLTGLSTGWPGSMDRGSKPVHIPSYVSPTNASVATLIRTDGGNTSRKAVKHARTML